MPSAPALEILRRKRRDPAPFETSPTPRADRPAQFPRAPRGGVDIRVAIRPAAPLRFVIVNPSSFTQTGLMFERCT
jgi:hypothetical protein